MKEEIRAHPFLLVLGTEPISDSLFVSRATEALIELLRQKYGRVQIALRTDLHNGRRLPRGHSLPLLRERFLALTSKEVGCWKWKGGHRGQYGILGLLGKGWGAHRLSYELFVGPLPEGMTVDHLCRNTICVNPKHLEAVHGSENSRRQGESTQLF
jgi:hypothetical protein